MLVKINEIIVRERLRTLNTSKVRELSESIKEIGLLNPIVITKENVLVAGNHRLEACKLLKCVEIEVNIVELSDLLTELAEIDENLIRNELHFTDRGDHLTRRKEIYEELYPETKVGSKNKSNDYGKNLEKPESVFSKPSFVSDTSIKTGKSETVIKEEIQISKNISPEIKEQIRESNITKTEALNIARMIPEKQKQVVEIAIEKNIPIKKAIQEIKQDNRLSQLKQDSTIKKELLGEIIVSDFFDAIDNVANKSVDLLFVDPPYGILSEDWDAFESIKILNEFTKSWLDLACKKVKDTGRIYICFSQRFQFELYKILENNNFYGFNFGQMLIWNYKNNNQPSNRKEYRYAHEPIFYLYGKQAETLNFTPDTYGEMQNSVWTIATPQSNFNEGKFHPAQKPIELLETIIKTGSKENDLVLDPFAGSGTTGLVCQQLNRKYILIEKSNEYAEIARGRINGVV